MLDLPRTIDIRFNKSMWSQSVAVKRVSTWIVIIVAVVMITVIAFDGLRGGSQFESTSEAMVNDEQIPFVQACIDSNEQVVEQVQQVDSNSPKDNEIALVALLKLQEEEELRKLDEALIELDSYIATRRKEIEDWYASEFQRLKLWAENRVKELDGEAKVAYARCLQKMQNTISNSTAVISENTYVHADTYYSPYGYASTDGYAYTDGVLREVSEQTVVGNPVGDYKLELESIKESQRAVEGVFSELLQKRERYLWQLESYAKSRRAGIEGQKRLVRENTEVKLAGGPGVIDAISCSGAKPFIMLSGEILYEGDFANGFKIKKIYPTKVEFEKDGEIWVRDL